MTARVLIVDDDVVVRRLLRHILQQYGFEVLVAADGREALAMLDDEPVALAIVDRTMPVLDGVGLVRAIRGSDQHRRLPIIMLTGSIAPSIQEEADAIGVNRLLTKLVASQELIGAVYDLLGGPPPGADV